MAFVAMIFGCVHNINDIIFTNQKAGAEETIVVKAEFRNGTDCNGTYLVFAALVPSNLKLAETATVTFTTQNFANHGHADVVDARMVVMEETELEKMSGKSWKAELMSKYGTFGNYGDFEWVVWRNESKLDLSSSDNDSEGNRTQADIKLTFKNEARNVKFNFAALYATTTLGLEGDRYCEPFIKTYETTGGTGSENYTVPKLVTITPLKFTFEDIMGVSFMSKVTGVNTSLVGETDIYLMGKVVLNDGTELTVEEATADTKLTRAAENSYLKYIYPRQYFNVPANKTIKNMFFWFENADGSKVENAAGNLYEQYETGTPLK